MNHEEIREISERLNKGASISSVAQAVFPVLEHLKEQLFQEFAHAPLEDSLHLARLSGKAAMIDTLIRSLEGGIEDGKLATEELQRGGH